MQINKGRYFVSFFGVKRHLLFAIHKRFRVDLVRPHGKPTYRRLYLGFIEIEWKNHDRS